MLSNYHFAPTTTSRDNLLKENKDPKNIIVTGNTVIDALDKIEKDKHLQSKVIQGIESKFKNSQFSILNLYWLQVTEGKIMGKAF